MVPPNPHHRGTTADDKYTMAVAARQTTVCRHRGLGTGQAKPPGILTNPPRSRSFLKVASGSPPRFFSAAFCPVCRRCRGFQPKKEKRAVRLDHMTENARYRIPDPVRSLGGGRRINDCPRQRWKGLFVARSGPTRWGAVTSATDPKRNSKTGDSTSASPLRAATYTSRAASEFMKKIPSPTIKSGHADAV